MKTVIITGASRGIGRASALALASRGFAVLVNYSRSTQDAKGVVRAIRAGGGTAEAVRAYGGIDVVVTSAGVMAPSPLADATDEDFDRQFQVNVRGTFNALREGARRIRDGGRLIAFSSTTLALNAPGYAVYNATKGAVEGLVRVVAKELGPRGITANAVAPGPVETELFLRGKSKADIARVAGMAPMKRLGLPDDIAGVVAFLASPEAGWVNGQVIRANGGIA